MGELVLRHNRDYGHWARPSRSLCHPWIHFAAQRAVEVAAEIMVSLLESTLTFVSTIKPDSRRDTDYSALYRSGEK
jgi:hypothetical protein